MLGGGLGWARRPLLVCLVLALCLVLFRTVDHTSAKHAILRPYQTLTGTAKDGYNVPPVEIDPNFKWKILPQHFPVELKYKLPKSKTKIPPIQTKFSKKSASRQAVLDERLAAVKSNFTHAWSGYKKHAWLKDEVAPLSGGYYDTFGGWAASLVDALGTLWIMDLHDEFEEAVAAVEKIDFSTCALDNLNVFETTIRYLGGFLSAYDLSNGKYPVLLIKAIELGEMLYHAFDTPNRMPILRWNFHAALSGAEQQADTTVLVAEIGSLTLEFTRLSQITGDQKWYDAVQRVMDVFEEQQPKTRLPGMWPLVVNARAKDFTVQNGFTLGGMADSLYEYLPKQYLLLGGADQRYRKMYESAMQAITKHILWRPVTESSREMLFSGQTNANVDGSIQPTEPQAQHLACFVGGMVGLGARMFSPDDAAALATARALVEGCLWAYEVHPLGIMPEIFHGVACGDAQCPWDEAKWAFGMTEQLARKVGPTTAAAMVEEIIALGQLPRGVTVVDDHRYILRPEAIESVFYLYRMTGEEELQDRGWRMFENIVANTQSRIAHAGLDDCTRSPPPRQDKMESFWLAETLRYFYLLFADEQLISLDEFVLNTEAHPLRRPL